MSIVRCSSGTNQQLSRSDLGAPLFRVTVHRGESVEAWHKLVIWVAGSVSQSAGIVISHGRHPNVHSALPTIGQASDRARAEQSLERDKANDGGCADTHSMILVAKWQLLTHFMTAMNETCTQHKTRRVTQRRDAWRFVARSSSGSAASLACRRTFATTTALYACSASSASRSSRRFGRR